MTEFFNDDMVKVIATVVEAGPCFVVSKKASGKTDTTPSS